MAKSGDEQQTLPAQPPGAKEGREAAMRPRPESSDRGYRGSGKLQDRVALITGGDSGIGRSVAVLYAREGADVAIVFREHQGDADETRRLVEREGRRCLTIQGDVGSEAFCRTAVEQTVATYGRIDVLVNNAGEQHPKKRLEEIDEEQLVRTFRTNSFGMFFLTKAALPHMRAGSTIVNTTSITAYQGSPKLLDYSSTKGAILTFTRSLSINLVEKGIRVNCVAPGPIWTPLIPSTFPEEDVKKFGSDVPMKRPGQPDEVATCFVFLASDDSSYMSGQTLHPNGGVVVNG